MKTRPTAVARTICRIDLLAGAKAEGLFPADLEDVVDEADQAEEDHGPDGHPDVDVGQVAPEERRDDGAEDDQDAAHRRRPFLGEMGLRAVGPDLLPDLAALEETDEPGAEEEAQDEGGDPGGGRAHGDVAEDVEEEDLVAEGNEEPVQHGLLLSSGLERVDDGLGLHAARALDQHEVAVADDPGDRRRGGPGIGEAMDGGGAHSRRGRALGDVAQRAGRR